MKTTLAILLLFSSLAHAVNLDLEKFKAKGHAALQSEFGSIFSGQGEVYFRDGAGSTDLEPLFDYSAYYYIVQTNFHSSVLKSQRVAYRLRLQGLEDIVLVPDPALEPTMTVATANSGIILLREKSKRRQVDALIARLAKIAPSLHTTFLDTLNIVTYEVKARELDNLAGAIAAEPLAVENSLDHEVYRTPFIFDSAVPVRELGKIDADQHRTVTRDLRLQFKFTTETTIPPDLQ